MNSRIAAFVSGLVFALGLGLSGMTQPAKVIAFLDLAGKWDPSLIFVMMGGILVHVVLYRLIRRRPTPLFTSTFVIPTRTDIDARLVGGAALFGIGWGLGGFCPGPAITSLASGNASVMTFVTAMLAGMCLFKLMEHRRSHPAPPAQEAAAPV